MFSGQESLDHTTAIQAIFIFGIKATIELATLLGLPPPTIPTPSLSTPVTTLDNLSQQMILASRTHQFDCANGVFVSGPDKQISWASQAWAVIAGIPESKEIGAIVLRKAYEDPDAVKGKTPYLHHYVRGVSDSYLRDGC